MKHKTIEAVKVLTLKQNQHIMTSFKALVMGSSFKATTIMAVPFRLCLPMIHTEKYKEFLNPIYIKNKKKQKKKKKDKRETYSAKNQSLPTFSFSSFRHSNLYTILHILTKCREREREREMGVRLGFSFV